MLVQSKKMLFIFTTQLIMLTLVVPAASFDDDLTAEHSITTLYSHVNPDWNFNPSYEVKENSVTKIKIIDRRIEKGLSYLHEKQLPSGEFTTYISYSPDISNGKNISVIFDTAFVLHTLNLVDNENTKEKVKEMKTKAVNFLLDNRDSHGVWRHEGKYITQYPPDTDNTAMAFAALVESGVNISNESLDYMLNFRTPDGVFYTWINSDEWLNTSSPYYNKFKTNDIDANVNADVLYAYSLRNRTQGSVVRYLNEIAENKSFLNGTLYYPSPYVFTYLVTKTYSEGRIYGLEPSIDNIRHYLLSTQNRDGGWGNDLHTALATISLLNIGCKGKPLEKAIEHIQNTQKKDGRWGIYAFYLAPSSPIVYYGSQELTTSFSLEALIKYKKTIDHDCIKCNKN
ncbi:MAG: hypothetical protein D4R88_06965 [Methanosarcinales archaeon]|nr:MAG: hypothetical protein D4R88_06965 [Methanosarcinales archaeon]